MKMAISIFWFMCFLFFPHDSYCQNSNQNIFDETQLQKYLNQKKVKSVMIGLIFNNKKYMYSYGKINSFGKKNIIPNENTLYEIGSITKVFTSLLLAESIKNKQNKLDDFIIDFLPKRKYPQLMSSITFKQLATHTSGFPRLVKNSINKFDALNFLLFGGDPYKYYSTNKMLKDLKVVNINKNQGKECVYSNYGVGLLGYILAKQSGTTYQNLLLKTVFKPLGMKNSYIGLPENKKENFATGHRRWGLKAKNWSKPGGIEAAGSIISSMSDMVKFLEANLDSNSQVSEILNYTHNTHFTVSGTRKMGLGWVKIKSEKTNNQEIIWHNGGTGGFRSFLGFNKDNKVGIVILSNSDSSVDKVAIDILNQLNSKYKR
jgi:serine-type D-Ala-D-Ala carboxypeptidase/endopeptidase